MRYKGTNPLDQSHEVHLRHFIHVLNFIDESFVVLALHGHTQHQHDELLQPIEANS